MKILCYILGHDDPVLNAIVNHVEYFGHMSEDLMFYTWQNTFRRCRRCGKDLKPK